MNNVGAYILNFKGLVSRWIVFILIAQS